MTKKDKILKLLGEYWETVPEWRFCQLISNLHGNGPQDIFYTEDDNLIKYLEARLEDEK